MKICIIMNVFSVGGFTASILPMLKYLSAQGVQVQLLLFEKSDIPVPEYDGLTVQYITQPMASWKKWLRFFTNPYYMYRFAAATLFDRGRYTHLMVKWMQVLFYLNVSQYAVPHDLTAYDCVVAWEESFPSYYLSKVVKAKRKVSVFHTDYKIAQMDPHMDKKGYRDIDKIMTVSGATQKVLQEMLPFYSHKIGNFRNVLDVEKITTLAQQPTELFLKSSFDCITVARLENNAKALDRLVRICARLKADGIAFHWYLVGDGPYRAQFEAQIAAAEVGDIIHLLGVKSNPHPYTKQADLFVLQSYYEGKPISVDEALIIGTPALISEYKSAHEQIIEGENGFIAQNDEDAIYQKLKYLITHPEEVAAVKEKLTQQDLSIFTDTSSFLAQLSE
ncbi:MAG: glycosyltransferase [Faecalibacterium sp.]